MIDTASGTNRIRSHARRGPTARPDGALRYSARAPWVGALLFAYCPSAAAALHAGGLLLAHAVHDTEGDVSDRLPD